MRANLIIDGILIRISSKEHVESDSDKIARHNLSGFLRHDLLLRGQKEPRNVLLYRRP